MDTTVDPGDAPPVSPALTAAGVGGNTSDYTIIYVGMMGMMGMSSACVIPEIQKTRALI